jgi:hypothetical protein
MLGRHVYRVHADAGRWTVIKEGDPGRVAVFDRREEAVGEACRRAEADQPSKVIVDNGAGIILEERLFGSDLSDQWDSPP